MVVGVVGVVALTVRRGGARPAALLGEVVDRGVHLQLAVGVLVGLETVLDDPRDLGQVLGEHPLALDDAGLDDDVAQLVLGDLEVGVDLLAGVDHHLQLLLRGRVGGELVGAGEEEALELPLGGLGQVEVGRVDGLVVGDLVAGRLGQDLEGLGHPQTLADGDAVDLPVAPVEQPVEGGLRAHLLGHPVGARLDAARAWVGGGGGGEGAGRGDDVLGHEDLGDLSATGTLGDLDEHLAGAGALVVLGGGLATEGDGGDQVAQGAEGVDRAGDHQAGGEQQGDELGPGAAPLPAPRPEGAGLRGRGQHVVRQGGVVVVLVLTEADQAPAQGGAGTGTAHVALVPLLVRRQTHPCPIVGPDRLVRGLRALRGVPVARPERRASSAACRMSTAAAWSTTPRRCRPRTPLLRRAR